MKFTINIVEQIGIESEVSAAISVCVDVSSVLRECLECPITNRRVGRTPMTKKLLRFLIQYDSTLEDFLSYGPMSRWNEELLFRKVRNIHLNHAQLIVLKRKMTSFLAKPPVA